MVFNPHIPYLSNCVSGAWLCWTNIATPFFILSGGVFLNNECVRMETDNTIVRQVEHHFIHVSLYLSPEVCFDLSLCKWVVADSYKVLCVNLNILTVMPAFSEVVVGSTPFPFLSSYRFVCYKEEGRTGTPYRQCISASKSITHFYVHFWSPCVPSIGICS